MPLPTCPTDCTSALAPVNFSKCAPEIVLSEIRRIFIAKANAAAFTDWQLATEWTTRISETDITDADTIRAITVIGDKPAPAPVTKEVSNGRSIVIGKDHTVNYTIDDISEENYEFMRTLECGGQYRVWYETEGGYIYGGNSGILATITGDDILNRGRDEIETINGVVSWRAKHHPDRILSPIFDSDYSTAA